MEVKENRRKRQGRNFTENCFGDIYDLGKPILLFFFLRRGEKGKEEREKENKKQVMSAPISSPPLLPLPSQIVLGKYRTFRHLVAYYVPNHQWWHAKWKLSQNAYILHTRFCIFGTNSVLSRCLLTKFLYRSSVGSLLRVHCWLGRK